MAVTRRIVYHSIKSSIFGGLATLTEKRFVFYSILSLLALTVSTTLTVLAYYGFTTYSLILSNFAAATSLCMLISGGVALFMKRTIERMVETIVILSFLLIGLGIYRYSILFFSIQLCISLCFYGWIIILNLAIFSAILNLITGWSNQIKGFRTPKNAILFDLPIKIITCLSFVGFGILIWQLDLITSISGLVAGIITLLMIFIYVKKSKNDVFVSVVGLFFIFVVYHLVLYIWNKVGSGAGSLVFEAFITFIATLYSVQIICRRLDPRNEQKINENKNVWDDGAVIVLLGTVLGYLAYILNNLLLGESSRILISRFHQYSIILSTIILVAFVILFFSSISFRNYVSKRLGTI